MRYATPAKRRTGTKLMRGFALVLGLASGAAHAQATFTPLGDLPGGTVYSVAWGVSADGSVVVGTSDSGSGLGEAFRWTSASGMVGLGDFTGGESASTAYAVSADGSVVVGFGSSSLGYQAFRWTAGGGMAALGDLAGGDVDSGATALSADGSVVVGYGNSPSGYEAFRWTAGGGMVGLGDLAGGSFSSSANGVSADGTVIAGTGSSSSGNQAFRWTAVGGLVGLGDLAGGSFDSGGVGMSANGAVIVGNGSSTSGIEAFRWTAGGGMVGLGDLAGGGFGSRAYAVSADGAVVVGPSLTAAGNEAFVWTAAAGMRRLASVLTANGATGLTGWALEVAESVSADGSTVVGVGIDPFGKRQAFAARLGDPITGTAGADNLLGTAGPDTIDGLGGADVMTGLDGNDTYIIDNVGDTVVEAADDGVDTIRSAVTYTLPGYVENLLLTGTAAIDGTGNGLNNTLTGNDANNVLNGQAGTDTMKGGAGNDTYYVHNAGDKVVESADQGTDTVRSSIGFALPANVEHLVLTGTAAANGTGNVLVNRLTGNGASNTLNGKLGNDTLTGGAGADRFLFDTAPGTDNLDKITDFSPVADTIRLENAVFTALTTGTLPAAAFRNGLGASTTAHRVIYDPATGNLRYDADGTGPAAAVRFATLTTKPAVTNADFVVQ